MSARAQVHFRFSVPAIVFQIPKMGVRRSFESFDRFRATSNCKLISSILEQFPATKLGTVFGAVYRRPHSNTGVVLRLSY